MAGRFVFQYLLMPRPYNKREKTNTRKASGANNKLPEFNQDNAHRSFLESFHAINCVFFCVNTYPRSGWILWKWCNIPGGDMAGQIRTSFLKFLLAKTLLLSNEQRGLHSRRCSRAHTMQSDGLIIVTQSLITRTTYIFINAHGTLSRKPHTV